MWTYIQRRYLSSFELEGMIEIGTDLAVLLVLIAAGWVIYLISRRIILQAVGKMVVKSKTKWDDYLLKRRFFKHLCYLAPGVFIFIVAPLFFTGSPAFITLVQGAAQLFIILSGLMVVNSLISATLDIYNSFKISQRMPLQSVAQVLKIVAFAMAAILIISLMIGKSPTFLLGGLGAMTAVLILVFRDSILGLVAGIQLTSNDMLHIGDWIEMPTYGANGTVTEIALTTVKVQNWDKTITTVPAYALITDSFKNWRGMSESGGRRIARAVNIDQTSIKFCTSEMIDRFRKFSYLEQYIDDKQSEFEEINRVQDIDSTVLVNGRRLTNVGIFRIYLVNYLRNHPKIHQDMTFLVRQLEPTDKGLPIQIYVFSNDQAWANYEAIQADIFDHILAVVPQFELRVFQNPTGLDVRAIRSSSNEAVALSNGTK